MSNPIIVDPGFTPSSQTVIDGLIPKKTSWTDYWIAGATILNGGVGLYVPVLLDGFTRTDTSPGTLGTAPRGGLWSPVVSAHIASNKMVQTVAGITGAAISTLGGRRICLIEADAAWAATSGGTTDSELIISVCGENTIQNGLQFVIDHGSVEVATLIGGAFASLGILTFTPAADGSSNKIQIFIDVDNSEVRIFNNGTEITSSPLSDVGIASNMAYNFIDYSIANDDSIRRPVSVTSVGAFVRG